jgi:lysozyme
MNMVLSLNGMVIDLSHWNEVTDWGAVAAYGTRGVIHKFSQGKGYRDPNFDDARRESKANGMLFGRYHFADASDVKGQVNNFLHDRHDDELLALDWEDNPEDGGGTMSLSQAVAFVQEVERLTGQIPALYSGNTLKQALGSTPNPSLARCRLWLAHYASQPVCPPGWSEPWLWQWSQSGACPGIVGDVDQDAYKHGVVRLRQEWTGIARQHDGRPRDSQPEATTVILSVPTGTKITVHTNGDPDLIKVVSSL